MDGHTLSVKKPGLLSPCFPLPLYVWGGGRTGLEPRALRCHSEPLVYTAAPQPGFSHSWWCPCVHLQQFMLSAHHRLLERSHRWNLVSGIWVMTKVLQTSSGNKGQVLPAAKVNPLPEKPTTLLHLFSSTVEQHLLPPLISLSQQSVHAAFTASFKLLSLCHTAQGRLALTNPPFKINSSIDCQLICRIQQATALLPLRQSEKLLVDCP